VIALALALLVAGADPDRGAGSPWAIPATGDDTGLFLGAQLFTSVDATFVDTAPDTVLPAFRLDRLEVGGGGLWQRRLGGLWRMETIRSATPQSAFGIDGNSLLPRLRLAYGVVRGGLALAGVDVDIEARVGLVPEPWLETLERRLGARGLLPLPSERAGLLSVSDLGVTVDIDVGDGAVDVRAFVGNGEGHTELERNASKNVGAVVVVVPVVVDVLGGPLALGGQLGGRYGTLGVADVADHRAQAALFASHPRLRVGLEAAAGFGFQQRAAPRPVVAGGFVDAVIVPGWLGVALRGDTGSVDSAVVGSTTSRGLLALFCDLGLQPGATTHSHAGRARLSGGLEGVVVGVATGPVPGVPSAGRALRAFVQLEVTGLTDIVDLAARGAVDRGRR